MIGVPEEPRQTPDDLLWEKYCETYEDEEEEGYSSFLAFLEEEEDLLLDKNITAYEDRL